MLKIYNYFPFIYSHVQCAVGHGVVSHNWCPNHSEFSPWHGFRWTSTRKVSWRLKINLMWRFTISLCCLYILISL